VKTKSKVTAVAAVLLFALCGVSARTPAGPKERPALKLATTTSTVDSGLLDALVPKFEKKCLCRLEVISVGTGKALKLGENGDVDVVLVHARELEDKFVKDGFGVNRRDVMYNDFIVIGPSGDPAGAHDAKTAAEAFSKIAKSESRFISRGDKSGTDIKEKDLWKTAGISPSGEWYVESGQGMGATIAMADEMGAYTFTDRATMLSFKSKTGLKILFEKDPTLLNYYGVIAVNPKKYAHVKYALAMKFVNWMTSRDGRKAIADFKIAGVSPFTPYPRSEKKKTAK